jgi:putative membrane protein
MTTISTDSLDSNSRAFIVKAATANFMEISKANVALKKAGNTALKDFSKTIVNEHTQLNSKLKNIIQPKKIAFPAEVNVSQQNEIDAITKQQGPNFDVNYASNMIGNIQADLEYYTQASKSL